MKYWKYVPLVLIATGLTTGCNHASTAKTVANAPADTQATSQTSIPKALPAVDRAELDKMLHH